MTTEEYGKQLRRKLLIILGKAMAFRTLVDPESSLLTPAQLREVRQLLKSIDSTVSPTSAKIGTAPVPAAVGAILRACRDKYHATPPSARPNLQSPVSYCGMFTQEELSALAQAAHWPLPQNAVAYILESEPKGPPK